jgi:hypothetical protein
MCGCGSIAEMAAMPELPSFSLLKAFSAAVDKRR